MKRLEFNREKSKLLKKKRGVSFEEVVKIIERNDLIGIITHPNKKKYPNQKIFLIKKKSYIFAIPFVEDETKIFLKTIYPSRKHTKKYIR